MWGGREKIKHQHKYIDYTFDSMNVYYSVIVSVVQSVQKSSWRLWDIGSVVKEIRKMVGLDELKGDFQPN